MQTNRRTRILDSAARLMNERGFSQTSVDDVIRAAGLSGKSHFYHYFKSKEQLGYEVLEWQFERFAERGLALLREPLIDPLERLNLFIDAIVALQADREGPSGSPFGNLAVELAESHEGFRAKLDLVFERWARQLEALFWELRPQLIEHTDTGRLARFVIAALEGGMLMTRVTRDVAVMQGIGEDLKCFVSMYMRDPHAHRLHATTTSTRAGEGS